MVFVELDKLLQQRTGLVQEHIQYYKCNNRLSKDFAPYILVCKRPTNSRSYGYKVHMMLEECDTLLNWSISMEFEQNRDLEMK